MDNTKEYIACAAIHAQDEYTYQNQPINIKSGIVICGHRHGPCYVILDNMDYIPECLHEMKIIEGFLTSHNRFVDRSEGWIIAKNNCQVENAAEGGISISDVENTILISEDLY